MTGTAFAEHLAEQPDVVAGLLDAGVPALDPARPVVLSGIGTSLHACRIAAGWLRVLSGGRVRALAIDTHDLALTEPVAAADQVVVVTHRGTKRFSGDVLLLAAEAGAATVAVTGEGPHELPAGTVVRTCPQERASTHTVSYTAALTVLARIVCATLGEEAEPLAAALAEVPEAMARTLELPLGAEAVRALTAARGGPVLVAGTGLDAVTADEAALKIKEGTYTWAEGMHTEFALHGPPAVLGPATPAYLIRPVTPDGDRYADLAGLLAALGAPVLTCAEESGSALPIAHTHPLTRPLVTVLPFQRLVGAAAAELGADPDQARAEAEPWGSAIEAVRL